MKIGQWNMTKHPVCLITGCTGEGKTWLCAHMAEEALQAGATVILADPAKGVDLAGEQRRRLERAGATLIGMGEYDWLVETLGDVQREMKRRMELLCDHDALPETVPPLILIIDDFTGLLWAARSRENENTFIDPYGRTKRLVSQFGAIIRKASSLRIGLVFIGQQIKKDMLPTTWPAATWKVMLHLLCARIDGNYAVLAGEPDANGNIIYPELERNLIDRANRPDAATMRKVTAHIREELEAQRTMLADRRRMGIGDNAMQVGAITALERLNAWCAQQYDTTNPYMDSPATRKETTRP